MKQEDISSDQSESKTLSKKSNLGIPLAIILAGLLIAGSILFSNGNNVAVNSDSDVKIPNEILELVALRDDDHILGDPNSPIVILEFSDTECPYCKQFHNTMNKIIEEYGDGRVTWVYRHFPLASLHSKAKKEAEATECAAELGGEGAFWQYTNQVYAETPSNDGLDLSRLPEIAEEIGLDKAKFVECLESGKYIEKIEQQIQNAVDLGGRGTPHSLVIFNGKIAEIQGAQPYDVIKRMIDELLAE